MNTAAHFYSCSDGFCGADDCPRCHGENFIKYPCEACNEQYPALAFDEAGRCPKCRDREDGNL